MRPVLLVREHESYAGHRTAKHRHSRKHGLKGKWEIIMAVEYPHSRRRLSRFRSILIASTIAADLASAVPAEAAPSPPIFSDEYDAYVEKMRHDWAIPGIAVAVVQNGEITIRT